MRGTNHTEISLRLLCSKITKSSCCVGLHILRSFLLLNRVMITLLQLFCHEKVVEFHLTDEASMFASAVQRLETLQDAINYERVVLVTHSYQITMTLHVTGLQGRAVCSCDIDANWTACHSFNNLVQLEVL